MKNRILLLVLLMSVFGVNAQVGVGAGFSLLKGFGSTPAFPGMHIMVEVPRDDAVTFYGRFTTTLMSTEKPDGTNYTYAVARDVSTNPYQIQVYYDSKINHNIIEGGTRYYFGEGYDSGFAGYGGGNFMLDINSVKRKYDDFDEVKYEIPSTEYSKGSILSIGVGVAGGVKYTFAGIGSLYLDCGLSYLLLAQPSNPTAQHGIGSLSRFNFLIGLGFRKEIY